MTPDWDRVTEYHHMKDIKKIKLSIIIPSLRVDNLGAFLWNVQQNTQDVEYEVIVVATPPVWLTTKGKYSHIIKSLKRIVWIPEVIPSGTVWPMNAGYKAAKGEWVTCLADEMQVTRGWASNMLRVMENYTEACGLFQFSPDFPWYYYGKLFSPVPFIRKSYVEKLGGFMDTNYNAFYADPDLSMRIYKAGGKIIHVPDAVIVFPNVHDKLHHKNVSKYLEKDRAYFRKQWDHLGTFKDPD